jgi:NADPH2:quinone reductase
VVGAGWGAYAMAKPELNREIQKALDAMIAKGTVRPIVGARFPLEQGAEAMRLIEERGATGKVVLEVQSE